MEAVDHRILLISLIYPQRNRLQERDDFLEEGLYTPWEAVALTPEGGGAMETGRLLVDMRQHSLIIQS